jgi:hypothetical protein
MAGWGHSLMPLGFHSLLELAMYSDPLDGACKHEGPAVYN